MNLYFNKLCTTHYYFATSRLTLWLVFLRRSHLSPHLIPRVKEEVNRVLMRVTEGSMYRRRVRVPPEMSQTPMKHLLTMCAWPPKGLRMRPRNPLFLVFTSRVSASIIEVGLQYAPASSRLDQWYTFFFLTLQLVLFKASKVTPIKPAFVRYSSFLFFFNFSDYFNLQPSLSHTGNPK